MLVYISGFWKVAMLTTRPPPPAPTYISGFCKGIYLPFFIQGEEVWSVMKNKCRLLVAYG
jgi:hypothetical protein